MQGLGYSQIYTVFYVITLCCCLSINVNGRTLSGPQSRTRRSSPLESADSAGSIQLQDKLSILENILENLEANRQEYAARQIETGMEDALGNVGSSKISSSPSLSSLESSRLWKRIASGNSTEKRRHRPCQWNVVSCYGR
ncbi:hypothetical protein PoB_003365300 [Plakobranchus ocellatus]|uniref:Allatostatin C n=1 Tax=Plakobranchus ocellatus TaxID=259542 RepID=A0AAV4AIT0_9GAST|nr:hypothetical protein PoB_003365300 [Plakobranchus ocellatus]